MRRAAAAMFVLTACAGTPTPPVARTSEVRPRSDESPVAGLRAAITALDPSDPATVVALAAALRRVEGEERRRFSRTLGGDRLGPAVLSPDGSRLVTVGLHGARILDATTLETLVEVGDPDTPPESEDAEAPACLVRACPDGSCVLVLRGPSGEIVDVSTGDVRARWDGGDGETAGYQGEVAMLEGGRLALERGRTVELRDGESGRLVASIERATEWTTVRVAAGGRRLVVGLGDDVSALVDPADGRVLSRISGLAVTPVGPGHLVVESSGSVAVHRALDGELLWRASGDAVYGESDPHLLVSAAGHVEVRAVADGSVLGSFELPAGASASAISPDGTRVVLDVGDREGSLVTVDGTELGRLGEHRSTDAAFLGEGRYVVRRGDDAVRVYRVADATLVVTLPLDESQLGEVVSEPGGRRVAFTGSAGVAWVVDLEAPDDAVRLSSHPVLAWLDGRIVSARAAEEWGEGSGELTVHDLGQVPPGRLPSVPSADASWLAFTEDGAGLFVLCANEEFEPPIDGAPGDVRLWRFADPLLGPSRALSGVEEHRLITSGVTHDFRADVRVVSRADGSEISRASFGLGGRIVGRTAERLVVRWDAEGYEYGHVDRPIEERHTLAIAPLDGASVLELLAGPELIAAAVVSGDGSRVVARTSGPEALHRWRSWSVLDGSVVADVSRERSADAVLALGAGERLVVASSAGVELVAFPSLERVAMLAPGALSAMWPPERVGGASLAPLMATPDGRRALVVTDGHTLVADGLTGTILASVDGTPVAARLDGEAPRVAMIGGSVLRVAGLEDGAVVATVPLAGAEAHISPDVSRAVLVRADGSVVLWDLLSGVELATRTVSYPSPRVIFDDTGRVFLTASAEEPIGDVWDTRTGALVVPVHGDDGVLTAIASAGPGGRMAIADGTAVRLVPGDPAALRALACEHLRAGAVGSWPDAWSGGPDPCGLEATPPAGIGRVAAPARSIMSSKRAGRSCPSSGRPARPAR